MDMRRAVLREARQWLDTPYRHQASRRAVGCDCLGLVRGVWRSLYGAEPEALPPYTPDWAEANGEETLLEAARRWLIQTDDPQPGDVVVFRLKPGVPCKHIGILDRGGDTVIHAYWGRAVVESWLHPFWSRRIAASFRFPQREDLP